MQQGLALLAALALAAADLPIHCLNTQVAGKWKFSITANSYDNTQSCGYKQPDNSRNHFDDSKSLVEQSLEVVQTLELELNEPNLVLENGEKVGTWTMVYDEGFEFTHNDNKFFAFSRYQPLPETDLSDTEPEHYSSDCGKTLVGWYHATGMAPTSWGCFKGERNDLKEASLLQQLKTTSKRVRSRDSSSGGFLRNVVSIFPEEDQQLDTVMFEADSYGDLVDSINSQQSQWKAKVHKQFIGLTKQQVLGMLGGTTKKVISVSARKTKKAPADGGESLYPDLPESWDWTSMPDSDGNLVNYDTPVENQGSCGSCYAMAAISAVEARIRIKSKMKLQPRLSSQEILSCSRYNQGCEGGYPFLAGKHGADFGFVEASCMPYQADDQPCEQLCHEPGASMLEGGKADGPTRYYASGYHYIGGYYGGCNEYEMMKELHENGPIVLAMNAPSSLFAYSEGVYQSTEGPGKSEAQSGIVNPWEQVNHALVAVGWGVDKPSGLKYWKIKNSWGPNWGLGGYFHLRRGTDECAAESMAVAIDVHVPDQFL